MLVRMSIVKEIISETHSKITEILNIVEKHCKRTLIHANSELIAFCVNDKTFIWIGNVFF